MIQEKSLEVKTLEELFKENTSGTFPILADIQHDGIVWAEGDEQENGHLRLINDTVAVKYQGKKYYPASFNFVMPQEDGQKIGNTTVTVSAIDKRVVEVIRSIKDQTPTLIIEGFFAKGEPSAENNYRLSYSFSKLCHYEFKTTTVDWDSLTAKWALVFDPAMQINVPIDKATTNRCPSTNLNK